MLVSKKKPTTPASEVSTQESSSPALPEQKEFHQYVRRLAVSAVQVLIEHVMREELEQCIGASWGEITPNRRRYRNGSYTRDLGTSTGRIQDLKVPRDREGEFHSQVFERYHRYEPEVAEALTQMFVSGTSTHTIGEVAQTLIEVAPSASAVSRLNQTLTEQFEVWRERPLLAHYRILYAGRASISPYSMELKPTRRSSLLPWQWIWKETRMYEPCEPVQRKTRTGGLASCKTFVAVGPLT